MKTRTAIASLAIAPLVLAFSAAFDSVSFGPESDSRVTRTYGLDVEFELDDLSVVADGQDLSEMVPADIGGSVEMMMKVTDHFVRVEGGRALELVRSYDEMTGEAESMGESQDIEEFTDLEGTKVRFAWNEDDEDYEVAFFESEGDEDLLEGMSVDMDMTAFLPPGEVDEGDTWSVESSKLAPALFFGQEPGEADTGGDPMAEMILAEMKPQFEAMMNDLETLCEYNGTRDEGGVNVGVIGVKMTGEGTVDLAGLITSVAEQEGADAGLELDIATAELTLSLEGEGTLLWDIAAGRMHGFQMESELEIGFEVDVSADMGGESHSANADGAFLGTITWNVAPTDE